MGDLTLTVSTSYTQRTSCRLCDGHEWDDVLSLGDQYLATFIKNRDENLPRAPLELVRCQGCGLLQLKHTVKRDLMYAEYFYRSSINQTMRDALADVVWQVLKYHTEGNWLDIGANDGYLLSRVPDVFNKVAVEPALNFAPDLEEHADLVVADYFSREAVDLAGMVNQFEVITSCAMFYDVDDPKAFVSNIAQSLTADGVWINQFSDAHDLLREGAFDAICHEHLSYWDMPNLARLYNECGLRIIHVSRNDVNGGSVRVVARRGSGEQARSELITTEEIHAFARRVKRWKVWMNEFLYDTAQAHGPLWCIAGSTKGCCLMQYLDCNQRFLAIAERNPRKHGLVQSGSWLPILNEDAMRRDKPYMAMVQAWPFKTEIIGREAELVETGTKLLFPLPHPMVVT